LYIRTKVGIKSLILFCKPKAKLSEKITQRSGIKQTVAFIVY